MNKYACIDFENANCEPSSVCSVGVVIVKEGMVTDRYYSLIHPEPDYYNYFCQKVHGLSDRDTCNARNFPEVWADIAQ